MTTTNPEPIVIIGAGQSGLAAARATRAAGLRPLVLEASAQPAGAWPHYYDSLTLFSPAGFSALPGLAFPGDPDHYPHRDEVVAYLLSYARTLGVEIRTGTRVAAVAPAPAGRFIVHTEGGPPIRAAGIIAASGSFTNPYRPHLPGQPDFPGPVRHVADYRNPAEYAGQRVIVVGAGNSAIQVGYELAQVARVTLATRAPVRFLSQRVFGKDLHYWLRATGVDRLPARWLTPALSGTPVLDSGRYRAALTRGQLDRRPMFTGFHGDQVSWPDGNRERVDAVLLATGYRPALDYLASLGALAPDGSPRHQGGISTTHPGLVYVGLEFQRSFASNTLRGVHRDAAHVLGQLAAPARAVPAGSGNAGLAG